MRLGQALRVGMIGTGAISHKHAQAYHNIGYKIAAACDVAPGRAEQFCAQYGGQAVETWQEVCRHPEVDFVDVCTFPDFRLEPIELCAITKKHVQVQKPIATNLDTAKAMVVRAERGGILLSVVSQHRFDDSSQFLKRAIGEGRLGKILEADAYVKWFRSAEYYSRPIKGSWKVEGGGALINQAVHQVDILLWLIGSVKSVYGEWQLGALHKIESEDVIASLLRYENGATGVIQASTAFWPGYTERLEIHGTKGTAIISGDKLTTWDVEGESDDDAPIERDVKSGASDPMAISLTPFERQFLDFGDAIREGRKPLVSGEDGYRALELVEAIYRSCRQGSKVVLSA
jgi:UDP-N-acetyl-2-amino-2-deoxyglucuronate dehydrogenase